ncbi:uncharacterized protein FFUJ_01814 [Fusarium fujikuroi IMI 58289]|uniref:Uncharacterized protein n=1 Tax=Gibberella fujikuroi (strain CBS 195.34 / IMI 58289 / NRRL A-6831) TaxID=1279085 RepID=S0DHL7_GIBF5|nr:uncharacterized protein FFUJ_01814 [Fusarium fujikuroi IMI 58289]KLP13961.1 uncharacterized protein LW94_404 [Fusarium fujikuroi]CCT61704.1 uncharacterized protein FFUJ_01814 [Fusarium fujikuroi IMI 58289]SCO12246.1 uncharacterized protein FFM5_10240 [Fusarium fujikuroi]SCO27411.1 uncharacterized protein FFMR_00290 [Fusarium fujikuroi]SCV50932.1 uncharacterized protein FFB14_11721 [Fusarium fujikuroi]
MYVARPERTRKPSSRPLYSNAVAKPSTKKHKQSQQKRPDTPTKTAECIEVSSSPTHPIAAHKKHDVAPGAVVSATAYKHIPPGAVVSPMTPEVLRTLAKPGTSQVFGFWLLNQVEHIYVDYRNYCLKEDEYGYPRKTKLGMLEVNVPENGTAIPFDIMSVKHPSFQKVQLLQGVQFIFYSPESLVRFANILVSTLFLPRLLPIVPCVQIKLVIFDPTCLPQAPELMAWQEIGVDQDPPASWTLAYKHYDDWMKAVKKFCKLPVAALVTLHFCYPYRDFDNLESLSKPLRVTENLGLLAIDFEGKN